MKRLVAILLLLVCLFCRAENVTHENILYARFGGIWQQDQYLSPLLYTGMSGGIGNEWWQPFSSDTRLGKQGKLDHWGHLGKVDLQFGMLYNPTKSNRIYAFGVQGGWGAYYTWQFPQAGVQILLGPYLNLDYAPRFIAGNVNKPYSMDIAIEAEAMGGISYSFRGKHSSYRLRYLIHANLIGIDFVPDYWQSYYELAEGVSGIVRCAGMWNHRYLRHELTLDMQFRHSTWRLGIKHEYLEYGQGDMWFSREQVSAVVGTCFQYKLKPNQSFVEW